MGKPRHREAGKTIIFDGGPIQRVFNPRGRKAGPDTSGYALTNLDDALAAFQRGQRSLAKRFH